MTPDGFFWMEPEWWAERGDVGVSRNQLTDRWTNRLTSVERSGVDPKRFKVEFRGWANALGQCAWVRELIGPTAAMYLRNGVNTIHRDPENWNAVSHVLGSYALEPSRYCLSFIAEVEQRSPDVDDVHDSDIRERARSAAGDVRRALLDPIRIGSSVLASAESARAFTQATQGRRPFDRGIAMRSYAVRLLQYAFDHHGDERLQQAVEDAVADIAADFNLVVKELQDDVEVLHREEDAKALVWPAVQRDRNEAKKETDWYPTAIKRAITTINRSLSSGAPIPDADDVDALLKKKVWSVEKEQYRPKAATTQTMDGELLAGVVDRQSTRNWSEDRDAGVDAPLQLGLARDFLRDVEIYAHTHPNPVETPLRDFWEKSVALSIVANETRLIEATRATVRSVVGTLWRDDPNRADRAACTNVKKATGLVDGLLALAVGKAAGNPDDVPHWMTQGVRRLLQLDRLTATDAVFEYVRERTAQDVYDELNQNGAEK